MKTLEYSIKEEKTSVPWALWLVPAAFAASRVALECVLPMRPLATDHTLFRYVMELPFYWVTAYGLGIFGVSAGAFRSFTLSMIVAAVKTGAVAAAMVSVWYVMRLMAELSRAKPNTQN